MNIRNAIVSVSAVLFLAACATVPPESRQLAANFNSMQPTSGLSKDMTMAQAEQIRDGLVAELMPSLGRVVGYKAGLTNPAVQKRFGVDHPLRGVLLEKMLLEDGAQVPAKFGAVPFSEADIVVVVKDEGINQAKTPAEVMSHLASIRPFIELPDLVTAKEQPLTGAVITAFNVGARLGVLGKPIPAAPEMADALARMTVVMRDQDGKELARAPGSAILGHPLNVVVWMAQDLAKSGDRLRAGDILSLGSFTAPQFTRPGTRVTVTYEGLPGNPTVSVGFK
ncbi:MAG TPA: hydratase [Candidatus Desulfobacillus sp.]|nr:hydratase [Candidatus Desulfobacillus sp.]